jgi:hypothetical protein
MDVAEQQVERNRAYNHASLSYVTTNAMSARAKSRGPARRRRLS